MDSAIKSGYRLGIEYFYGYVFGKRANQAMKTDTELLNNLRSLDFWGAIGKLHHKGLIATEVVLAIATAACAVGLAGRNQKSTELPSMGQPTIGLITESIAGSDPQLTAQLNLVKTLSGNLNCVPQIIAIDAGDGINTESVGVCKIKTDKSEGSVVVAIKSKDGTQNVINEDLLAYPQRDTQGDIYAFVLAYKNGKNVNGISEVMWVYKNGGGEYVFTNGTRLELDKPETEMAGFSFEKLLGNLLDPGNVAQAAEATQVYDPTKQATITLTPDGRVTVTQEPAISLLSPLDTAWVEPNWKMTDLSSPGKFTPEVSRISNGGLRITGEFKGALDFNIFDNQGSLILRIGDDGKVLLLDKSANTNQAYTVIGNVNVSGNYSLKWEIKPDGLMRIILNENEVMKTKIPSSILDFSDGGVKAILSQKDGSSVYRLGVGTIDKSPIKPSDPAPAPAPTATVEQGEGGLPVGAVRFDEGGIKGIRSPVPIPGYEPRFPNGHYGTSDCRVNSACDNTGFNFNTLQEAETYWKNKYSNARLRYEYLFFDDGGIAWVVVALESIGTP